jgi:hypothetical protein
VAGGLAVICLALALAGLRDASQALPRYGSRYEQKCALCHVNPSGGGLRTGYATQQLVPREIAWKPSTTDSLLSLDLGAIGRQVLLGADFRQVWIGTGDPGAIRNFFAMQSDLYIGFQPDPRVTIYYDRGPSASYEFFGVGYPHPDFYLKAGRFVPSYGWKFDDHTMYVRQELGLAPPLHSDVGLEAGYSRGGFELQASLLNGNRGATQDPDDQVAAAGNLIQRFGFGPFAASLGVSGYHQPGLRRQGTVGPYWSIGAGPLLWLGETDLFHREGLAGAVQEGWVFSHEVSWLAHRGWEILATYDFYDPDRFRQTGAKSRWGGGMMVMPWPYATIEARIRRTSFEDGLAFSGEDFLETVVQLHLLY